MKYHRQHLLQLVNDQYEALSIELTKKEGDIKNNLRESKKLLQNLKMSFNKLLKLADYCLDPVKGIAEQC